MEFDFDCIKTVGADVDGYAVITNNHFAHSAARISDPYVQSRTAEAHKKQAQLSEIIERMGTASAKAQGLKAVITTPSRIIATDHRVYLRVTRNKVIGLLKVGKKKLFIRNEQGNMREIEPLCVLDFYVHESLQRSGQGKILFEFMMDREGLPAAKFAYDRPSPKLLGFLSKHYGLRHFVPQSNNFVVYSQYFQPAASRRREPELMMEPLSSPKMSMPPTSPAPTSPRKHESTPPFGVDPHFSPFSTRPTAQNFGTETTRRPAEFAPRRTMQDPVVLAHLDRSTVISTAAEPLSHTNSSASLVGRNIASSSSFVPSSSFAPRSSVASSSPPNTSTQLHAVPLPVDTSSRFAEVHKMNSHAQRVHEADLQRLSQSVSQKQAQDNSARLRQMSGDLNNIAAVQKTSFTRPSYLSYRPF
eukprot:GILK01006428.1.p1 GENE.GILK01006428.1~~GILK01006428.1.p1  ORF type:complete len:416 (+),score=44.49 GILK01006428.1:106-1353(+)